MSGKTSIQDAAKKLCYQMELAALGRAMKAEDVETIRHIAESPNPDVRRLAEKWLAEHRD